MDGDVAMWMGWIYCIDKDGRTTKVDKSFGYKKDADGALRIVLHHSSLPYSPASRTFLAKYGTSFCLADASAVGTYLSAKLD